MAKKLGNLSSLQFALQEIIDQPQQADEFSVDDFLAEAKATDPGMTIVIARNRLQHMSERGLLKKRLVRRNGSMINLFRKA